MGVPNDTVCPQKSGAVIWGCPQKRGAPSNLGVLKKVGALSNLGLPSEKWVPPSDSGCRQRSGITCLCYTMTVNFMLFGVHLTLYFADRKAAMHSFVVSMSCVMGFLLSKRTGKASRMNNYWSRTQCIFRAQIDLG